MGGDKKRRKRPVRMDNKEDQNRRVGIMTVLEKRAREAEREQQSASGVRRRQRMANHLRHKT